MSDNEKQIGIRVSDEVFHRLKIAVAKERTSVAEVMRKLIDQWLEGVEK